VDCVGRGRRRGEVEACDEAGDGGSAGGVRAGAEERIEDLAAEHGDELVGFKGFAEVDGDVGRGEDSHLRHLTVDEVVRDVELFQHAERDGATAWLRDGRRVAFEEEGFDAAGSKRLRGGGSGGATANHCRPELSAGNGFFS